MRSVTEYHGGPKCLTRVHLKGRMVATTLLLNFVLVCLVLWHQLAIGGPSWWPWIPYGIFVFVLFRRARRLKRRVADLVCAAAERCGFTRMSKKP